ncbi:MAG: hypothetical protein RIQ52_1795 [Pseudomonadota bacterium]|jgi:hypothetical protein
MLRTVLPVLALFWLSPILAAGAMNTESGQPASVMETQGIQSLAEQRRALIRNNLRLTPEENRNFWPIYAEYERDVEHLLLDRLRIYEELGGNFDDLSDGEARKFVDDHWAYVLRRTDLTDRYLGRFAAVLPGKKLARYYQIEAHIRASIDAELYRRIPLVH